MKIELSSVFQISVYWLLWLLLCGLGIWVYRDALAQASHGQFPTGSLALLVTMIVLGPHTKRPLPTTSAEWIWTAVLLFLWTVGYQRIRATHENLISSITFGSVREYVLASLAFLAFIFVWVVAFPEKSGPQSLRRFSIWWRSLLTAIGIALGSVLVRQLFIELSASRAESLAAFNIVQGWLAWATLTVYAFLPARKLPGVIFDTRAVLESSDPRDQALDSPRSTG